MLWPHFEVCSSNKLKFHLIINELQPCISTVFLQFKNMCYLLIHTTQHIKEEGNRRDLLTCARGCSVRQGALKRLKVSNIIVIILINLGHAVTCYTVVKN